MNQFLWGVYPYLCIVLFFVVPIVRMVFRPFAWSTRASGMFHRRSLGVASLLLHWGLLLVLVGHLTGLFGGLIGSENAVEIFYWTGLAGGVAVLLGSIMALYRRIAVPEVRAMSQSDDYIVHVFLIGIVGLALYQVLVDRIFGMAFAAGAWAASLWTLSPQPELMASASLITKLHVLVALTFVGYLPFTKLVHVWTFPINYFVRPYQSMRTERYRFQRRWELAMRSDKSWLVYGLGAVAAAFLTAAALLGQASPTSATNATHASIAEDGRLMGPALYVAQCARCHGVDGHGDGAGAASPTFSAPPRDLTAGQYRFVSTLSGVATDDDLRATIRNGIVSSGMPAFDGLTDAQVDSLVAVLDTLWIDRPEAGAAIEVPPRPAITPTLLATGARVFRETCASCHGDEGRGNGPASAALNPHPRNFLEEEIKAGNEPEQMYMTVAAGLPPAMPGFLQRRDRATGQVSGLSPDDVWAVVVHIRSEFLRLE